SLKKRVWRPKWSRKTHKSVPFVTTPENAPLKYLGASGPNTSKAATSRSAGLHDGSAQPSSISRVRSSTALSRVPTKAAKSRPLLDIVPSVVSLSLLTPKAQEPNVFTHKSVPRWGAAASIFSTREMSAGAAFERTATSELMPLVSRTAFSKSSAVLRTKSEIWDFPPIEGNCRLYYSRHRCRTNFSKFDRFFKKEHVHGQKGISES